MSIAERDPNTILISNAPRAERLENRYAAIETLTPGDLLELHNDSGTPKWGVHDSADAATHGMILALDQTELNKLISDTYAAGSLVKAYHARSGEKAWVIIGSGEDTVAGTVLQSAGNGKFKVHGSGTALCFALETKTPLADTRVRVEVI